MYGIITDAELDRIEEQRESMDSLDWRSPNYVTEEYDRYGYKIVDDKDGE